MTAPMVVRPTVVVGIGELAAAKEPDVTLVTYALGSCLGITVYDPVARVGGMLHVMLPSADGDADGRRRPERYVDTGVPLLLDRCLALGASRARLTVKVAGGASIAAVDSFRIGERNIHALRAVLQAIALDVEAADTGGVAISRTMSLHIGTGDVMLRIGAARRRL